MLRRIAALVCAGALMTGTAAAQAKKAGPKTVMHDITVTADTVYTGTMEIAVTAGKVTGDMLITSPMEITGKVAGTSKAGVLTLEFPFTIVQEGCTGMVTMSIKLGANQRHGAGTMEAVGCGPDEEKVTGIVELKPPAPKPSK